MMKPILTCVALLIVLCGTAAATGPTHLNFQYALTPCTEATPQEMETAAAILKSRLSAWGTPAEVELTGSTILVKLPGQPSDSEREEFERVLTSCGGFALHDVIEAPSDGAPPPEGFEVPRWGKAPPPLRPPVFVRAEPSFIAIPGGAPSVRPPRAEWDRMTVHIPLAKADRRRLAEYTESRIGQLVGVVIDSLLWSSPKVMERMFGDLHFSVDTTLAEGRVLAALSADRPLGTCLEVKSTSRIDEMLEPPRPENLRDPVIDDLALGLFHRFTEAIADPQREVPVTALVRLRTGYYLDDEAVAEYLYGGTDRERIQVAISCLNVAPKLESQFGTRAPAAMLAETIGSMKDRILSVYKNAARSVLGLTAINQTFEQSQNPLFAAIVTERDALLDERQVDLLSGPVDSGEELIVRGIDGGRFSMLEVGIYWLTGSKSPDSMVVLGPEVDMRYRVAYTKKSGNLLPEWFSWSTGVPGDSRRESGFGRIDYRKVGEYWLAERLIMEMGGEATVAFEMQEAEVDIDLDGMDWADRVDVIHCDELEGMQDEASRRHHQEIMRALRKDEKTD